MFAPEDTFIDIHVHSEKYPSFPRPGDKMTYATPEELLAGYDEIGIERAVLLPECYVEGSHSTQSFGEVQEIAETHGGRFIPFCNADPRMICNTCYSPFGDYFKFYRDKGAKGIGEICANMHILDPMVQNMFKGAEESGLPLTFHMSPYLGSGSYGLVDEPGLPGLEYSLQKFPKLRFFGHSQMFWAEISETAGIRDLLGYPTGQVIEGRVPQLMRKYPNLYGDLSASSGRNALTRDPEYAVKFLTEFQDRLFFGTDICQPTMHTLRPLANFLRELRDTGKISKEIFCKVAKGNAIRELDL